ncbi:MAG: hypothetical protein ACP5JV_07710, partial [Thermus sp.]
MRKALWSLLLLGLALAQGRLEAGAYLGPRVSPTLEAGLALGEGEVLLRLQGDRGALGYLGSLSLGPLGYLAYGLQGEVGEGGLGGAAFLEGGAGPLALEGRLGYRPQRAYPLFPEEGEEVLREVLGNAVLFPPSPVFASGYPRYEYAEYVGRTFPHTHRAE